MNGKEIVIERTRHDVSQAALAKKAEIYPSTLSDIENDKFQLSDDEYERFKSLIREIAEERKSTENAA